MKKTITFSLAFGLTIGAYCAQPALSALLSGTATVPQLAISSVQHKSFGLVGEGKAQLMPTSPVDTVEEIVIPHKIVIRMGGTTVESNPFVVSHGFDPNNLNSDLPLATFEREHSHLVLSMQE